MSAPAFEAASSLSPPCAHSSAAVTACSYVVIPLSANITSTTESPVSLVKDWANCSLMSSDGRCVDKKASVVTSPGGVSPLPTILSKLISATLATEPVELYLEFRFSPPRTARSKVTDAVHRLVIHLFSSDSL